VVLQTNLKFRIALDPPFPEDTKGRRIVSTPAGKDNNLKTVKNLSEVYILIEHIGQDLK